MLFVCEVLGSEKDAKGSIRGEWQPNMIHKKEAKQKCRGVTMIAFHPKLTVLSERNNDRKDIPAREGSLLWRTKSVPLRLLTLAARTRKTYHPSFSTWTARVVGLPATLGSLQEQWEKSDPLNMAVPQGPKAVICITRALALAWVPVLFWSSCSPCTDHWFEFPFPYITSANEDHLARGIIQFFSLIHVPTAMTDNFKKEILCKIC